MKKRATPKKAASKKPAAKLAAVRSSAKPATKAKPAAKRPAMTPGPGGAAARSAQTYQPKPIQSTGWAPFRYPPQ